MAIQILVFKIFRVWRVLVRSTRKIHVRLLRVFIFTNQRDQKQIRRGEKKKKASKYQIKKRYEDVRTKTILVHYMHIYKQIQIQNKKKNNILFLQSIWDDVDNIIPVYNLSMNYYYSLVPCWLHQKHHAICAPYTTSIFLSSYAKQLKVLTYLPVYVFNNDKSPLNMKNRTT